MGLEDLDSKDGKEGLASKAVEPTEKECRWASVQCVQRKKVIIWMKCEKHGAV